MVCQRVDMTTQSGIITVDELTQYKALDTNVTFNQKVKMNKIRIIIVNLHRKIELFR